MKCPLDISRLELIYGRSLTGPSDASEVQMLQISGLFYLTIVESCRVGLFLSSKSIKSVQTFRKQWTNSSHFRLEHTIWRFLPRELC